jgi:hypothetical protein
MSGGLNKVSGGLFPAWAHAILKKFLSFCEYTFTQNILKSSHVLSHVLSLPSHVFDVLSFPCIILPMYYPCIPMYYPCTLRCLHMYYPCLSAQHKVCGDLKNKVTYTATVEQKRLRCFTCCLVLT